MEFMPSGPEIVRSDSQRRLLERWVSLRDRAPLPVWNRLDPNDFAVPLENLALMQVTGQPGEPRFRIAFHGSRLAEAFGPDDCVGKCLDEILPPPYQASALSTYREVVDSKMPVYTVSDMRDPVGRIVHHERLLLPFTQGGAEVERILASIEPVSPEGPFQLREIMKAPARPPVIALCATIQY
jgi:hypothetical protein